MQKSDIVFPKNWLKLTTEEQKTWIQQNCVRNIPESVFKKSLKVKRGEKIKMQDGSTLHIPKKLQLTKPNKALVQDYKGWAGTWLITVFHDKKDPFKHFIGISNPHSGNRIAQELSFDILRKLFGNEMAIGNKYGFYGKIRRKKGR